MRHQNPSMTFGAGNVQSRVQVNRLKNVSPSAPLKRSVVRVNTSFSKLKARTCGSYWRAHETIWQIDDHSRVRAGPTKPRLGFASPHVHRLRVTNTPRS